MSAGYVNTIIHSRIISELISGLTQERNRSPVLTALTELLANNKYRYTLLTNAKVRILIISRALPKILIHRVENRNFYHEGWNIGRKILLQ